MYTMCIIHVQQAKEQSHYNEYTCEDQHNLTLFNESIFGPILAKKKEPRDAELVVGEMPTKAKCMPVHAATCSNRPSNPNMFERMIRNFEDNGQMTSKKREGMGDQDERGVRAGEKPFFRNLEWKNFITGVTRQVCYMYLLFHRYNCYDSVTFHAG